MAALAFFRCDASPGIGAGHVMRCLAFARFLERAGWSCVFVTNPDAPFTVPSLTASGFSLCVADQADGIGVFDEGASLIVVDHYKLDASFERRLSAPGRTVVVFDDLADRSHVCDILVDPTLGRSRDDYADRIAPSTQILLGPDHAILGEAWHAHRRTTTSRIAERGLVRTILVSMGATDPTDATSRVMAAIMASGLDVAADIVLGAAAPHRDAVEARLGPRMTLHIEPPHLPDIAAAADLAVGAAGSSSFERAVLGLPTLMVVTAENQKAISAAFARVGAAEIVSSEELDDPTKFGTRIAALASDRDRRMKISEAASRFTDGRGSTRLLAAIAGATEDKDGARVTLRLAERDDETWLLDLQRQPQTRRFSRRPDIPTEEQHARWFADILDDDDRLLFIVENAGSPSGMVRLDRVGEPSMYEISIAIEAANHSRGIGAAALRLVRRMMPGADLIATVLPENRASLTLFAAAGFCPEGQNRYRSRA